MTILEYVLQWAAGKKLAYTQQENDIVFRVDDVSGSFGTRVRVLQEDGMLYVFSSYPLLVPPERRNDIGLRLAEKNLYLKVGALLLNPDTGEVAFRLGQFLLTEDEETMAAQVDAIIMLAVSAASRYFDEVAALISGEGDRSDHK